MQSTEVKSNVFYAVFSSAEQLGSQGELIVSLKYTHRDGVHPSVHLFERSSLKPLCQSKPNQVSSLELGTKVCINAQGRMTKMDTTPIYGKKL